MESTSSSLLSPVHLRLSISVNLTVFCSCYIQNHRFSLSSQSFIWATSMLQDTLVIKTPKKSPLLLTMVVLVFAMVCGVYICAICLKQTSNNTKAKFLKFQVINQASPSFGIEPWEIPYVHYPKPKTHSR